MKKSLGLRFVPFYILTVFVSLTFSSCVTLDFDASYKPSISVKEMDKELKTLKYLLTTSYVGYDEALEQGFDIDETLKKIRTQTLEAQTQVLLKEKQIVQTDHLQKAIFENLKNMNVKDCHFSVSGSYLSSPRTLYLTNIYIEENKKDGKFFVKYSDAENVKVGQEYTGPKENLYKAYYQDQVLLRYGVFTEQRISNAVINVGGSAEKVSLPKKEYLKNLGETINTIESEDSVYFSLATCGILPATPTYEKFSRQCEKLGAALPGKKNLILDLRDNGGGHSTISAQLVASIVCPRATDQEKHLRAYDYFVKETSKFKKEIVSKARKQAQRHYKKEVKAQKKEAEKLIYNWDRKITKENAGLCEYFTEDFDFSGKIYILINRNVASAAEMLVGMIHLLEKHNEIVLVGENSCGAVDYVAVSSYPLGESGLWIRGGTFQGAAPCIKEDPHFHGEKIGYFPDIWASDDTLLNTLVQLTGDRSLETALAGLEKRLL